MELFGWLRHGGQPDCKISKVHYQREPSMKNRDKKQHEIETYRLL